MTKRKFSKLLNKEAIYTAILKHVADKGEGTRVMISDVKHKNKLYADHAWISRSISTDKIPYNTEISFTGTAYMYNDKFDVRKQGLKSCKNFEIINHDYHDQQDREHHDAIFYKKRKGKL